MPDDSSTVLTVKRQKIRTPAVCQNFNRLICADRNNENWFWDFNIGDIDALAEPVVTADLAIVGTMEGHLYALRLHPADKRDLIAWQFKAAGAINTQVSLAKIHPEDNLDPMLTWNQDAMKRNRARFVSDLDFPLPRTLKGAADWLKLNEDSDNYLL